MKNETQIETECRCPKCIAMCKDIRPCWGTPEEIKAIIDRGFGGKLMLTYWQESGGRPVQILSPAICGYENDFAPTIAYGRCTFLSRENKCELHSLGLKPAEGRAASCENDKPSGMDIKVARSWLGAAGRELVRNWHESGNPA